MSRLRRSLFPLLLVLAGGCGDSTGPDAIPGLYVLQSVNGDPLPYVLVQQPAFTEEITAGQIQMNGDGTCSVSETFRVDDEGTVTTFTEDETCTWLANGSAISVTFPDDYVIIGSVVDGTLTIANEDSDLLVFVRQ